MPVIKKNILFSFFLFCCLALSGIHDSLINRIDYKTKKDGRGLTITYGGNLKTDLSLKWLYFSKNDTTIKYTTLKDTLFTVVDQTYLSYSDEDKENEDKKHADKVKFDGIAWYKLYFKLKPGQDKKTYTILYEQLGASEIYFDGHLIKRFGAINPDGSTKKAIKVSEILIPYYIPDTLVHSIAMRYSSSAYKKYYDKFDYSRIGPFIKFNDSDVEDIEAKVIELTFNITNMIAAFFIALFVIHLLIYLFYREKTFNLLYSLFLLFLSLCFFEFYYVRFIKDPETYLWVDHVDSIFFPTCCFFLVTLLNRLLNVKRTRHYIFFAALFALLLLDCVFFWGIGEMVTVAMVFYAYFNTMAHSIVGIRRKVPSAKFLGWGVLSFTICLLVAITVALLLAMNSHSSFLIMVLMIGFVILAILSIPLSMTAYLAYDFARTNKSLSDQLKTNETLHQEKEEILSNQNKVLEEQVAERTKEIGEQNKVLEHQKKEITDSINYARRIQQALLPEVESIKATLPNSFVFYMPKDIVSGDFYFFSTFSGTGDHPGRAFEQKEGGILIAAADCTGHGVPGALMSMIVHEKLEAAVKIYTEPAEILHSINQQVKNALKQNQNEKASRDGCDIALCKLQGNILSFAGAYRPLYLFRKDNSFEEIKATKTAIAGITPYEQQFTQHEFNMENLKAAYLFSDGFADQFGGSKSKKLTTKKFKELLNSIVDLPVNEQKQKLEYFFSDWKGNIEQIDDVLVIGITFP